MEPGGETRCWGQGGGDRRGSGWLRTRSEPGSVWGGWHPLEAWGVSLDIATLSCTNRPCSSPRLGYRAGPGVPQTVDLLAFCRFPLSADLSRLLPGLMQCSNPSAHTGAGAALQWASHRAPRDLFKILSRSLR